MALYVMIFLAIGTTFLASVSASPIGERDRQRAAQRRRRYVERNPSAVNSADIRARLVRDGVPAEEAAFITRIAAEHHIKPLTMWWWLQHFDPRALGIVVAADLPHRELVRHIEDGTVPNIEELQVFAGINGLPVTGTPVPPRAHRRVLTTRDHGARRGPTTLPEIFEPGVWPDGVLHVPAEWTAAEERSDGLPRLGEGRDDLAA